MNDNFRTEQDFIDNYSAGQLMRRKFASDHTVKQDQAQMGNEEILTTALQRARRQHIAPNPIVPNMADYVNWLLYDRYIVAAGSAVPVNFQLFTVPIGTNNKTKVDTNLDLVSQLPQPYWMNVTHIGFYWMPNMLLTDIINFLEQSYFEFWVNNKVYIEGPHMVYPGGAGIYGFSTIQGQQVADNGHPSNGNLYDLRLPAGINLGSDTSGNAVVTDGITGINILQSQNFKIQDYLPGGALTLTASTANPNGTGMYLYCFLHGILSRSVQ